ncbi:serine hydrolase domain-containing protein [Methylobacterium sp. E-066]|uniref:serine hydrolase domain-containing protein n=1 Tax=Methylobacterium sp. E-066 TaxID=2836584 RepID=UPI001FBBBBCB|nr:serine hydrolase domain-containing protein [Methylobacterium sp. E-066]MCJ2142109.1 beta-lactamase family protein [Methylobacterium sp. E-066]
MRSPPTFSLPLLDRLGDRLEVDVAAGAIAGADLLIGSHDTDIWRRTVGFRDPVAGDPLRTDAIWRIYSMTKVVVSVAALVLAERGDLRLDQPVADFIPAFNELFLLGTDGTRVPATTVPTVHDLLRHAAGIAYGYLGDGPTRRAYEADGLLSEDLDNAAFAERIASLPLEHQPGTVWHYSHATDVLGRVLEVASGADLQGVLDETILGPLGMADTRFRIPTAAAGRVAQPLPQAPGQRPAFHDPCLPRHGQRGNGGLVSTVADYASFLRMLLSDGGRGGARILSPASVRLMTADHLGAEIARGAYYPPGPGYGFGLGVAVRLAAGEAPFPGNVGDWFWSGVGGTYFWVDPAAGFFAHLMMQTSSAAQRQHYRTLTRAMVYAALDAS